MRNANAALALLAFIAIRLKRVLSRIVFLLRAYRKTEDIASLLCSILNMPLLCHARRRHDRSMSVASHDPK